MSHAHAPPSRLRETLTQAGTFLDAGRAIAKAR